MRVLVVDVSGPFGPLRSYLDMVAELEELGHAPTLAIPERSEEFARGRAPNAAIERLDARSSSRRYRAWTPALLRRVGECDVIHGNGTAASRVGAALALRGRRPLVVHLRNSALSRKERAGLRAIDAVLRRRVRFVAVSSVAADATGPRLRQRVRIVPNPVSPGPRRGLALPEGVVRIGAVANQQPTKGLDVLVDVMVACADRDVEFHLFGSASETEVGSSYVKGCLDRLRESGAERLLVRRGVVPSLSDELPGLDGMLITSRRESFSRVAAESMLAGVPLIAPRIAGLSETIFGGEHSLVYEVGDGRAAAGCVERLIDEYPDCLARAQEAQRRAESAYAPRVIAATIDDLYRALV